MVEHKSKSFLLFCICFLFLTMVNLSVMTWNVRGIMSSTLCLSELLIGHNIDICVISEHKLKEKSLHYLNSVEKGYKVFSKTDSLPNTYNAYHGKGGIAIMYKSTLDFYVNEIENIDSERVLGIELKGPTTGSLYVFAAYLPSDESMERYKYEIDILDSLYKYYSNYGNVLLAGDLNASCLNTDIEKSNKSKSKQLCSLIVNNNLLYAPRDIDLIGPSFTYVTKSTMLDYILFSSSLKSNIKCYEILAEGSFSSTSDHLPIITKINISDKLHLVLDSKSKLPAWHKITENVIQTYQNHLQDSMSKLTNEIDSNIVNLENAYQNFIDCLHRSAEISIPKCGFNPLTKPYWNRDVKEAHSRERHLRRIWVDSGRPRGMQYVTYREYKHAKYNFRRVQQHANEQYLKKCYDDLNEAAECDLRLFWKLIKRFKPGKSKVYPEIIYKDTINNTPQMIADAFSKYFSELYTPDDNEDFDQNTKVTVESAYDDILKSCSDCNDLLPGGVITEHEVNQTIKLLKRRKACGYDGIQHEHLIYGGSSVIACLTKLFNKVIEVGKIPNAWKYGLIVPIFKGGTKPKNLPDSYRPVSLLPCVLKVFEHVIQNRITEDLLKDKTFPNTQQQGFQKHLSCLCASFNLQETIYHNLEMFGKVYVAFLDSKKAFDTVWRVGLMYKLFNLGVKGKAWKIINDCHVNTQSAVVVNQAKSNFFNVTEGVRQGGVLSGFLYLTFIDQLLYDLENCSNQMGIFNIKSCCPTLADDVSCIATTPSGLQRMLDVCSIYACKWRFKFNANKSCIIQFSLQSRQIPVQYEWHIRNETIPIKDTYVHLGIELNSKLKYRDRIENLCRKGKNTIFATNVLLSKDVNPCSCLHIYKTVTLPTVLYGCELLSNLRKSDIVIFDTFQHFAAKKILNLQKRTRSDMCQSILGLHPIIAYIDKRKLYFLQKLCKLDDDFMSKTIFLTRLFSYFIDKNRTQYGFIPDVLTIVSKYGLETYMNNYLLNGQFPEKHVWKVIVNEAVNNFQTEQWILRINSDTDFRRFKNLHYDISIPRFLRIANSSQEIRTAFLILKLITDIPDSTPGHCILCDRNYSDVYVHACCNCTVTIDLQNAFWSVIMENYPVELFAEINMYDEENLYQILIGKRVELLELCYDTDEFLKVCNTHAVQCIAEYGRKIKYLQY